MAIDFTRAIMFLFYRFRHKNMSVAAADIAALEEAKQLIRNIPDDFRGWYYSIEEIAEITGLPVDQVTTLLNVKSGHASLVQMCVYKSSRVRLGYGESNVFFYSPFDDLHPASTNTMRSAEERADNLERRPPVRPPAPPPIIEAIL